MAAVTGDYLTERTKLRANHRQMESEVAKIVKKFGAECHECFRKPLQEALKEVFMGTGEHALKQKKPPYNVMMLKEKRFRDTQNAPPGNDHSELFLWNGKPLFYVYHPYDGVDDVRLKAWCETYGLAYDISPSSWYYLGQTLRVTIFDPKEAEVYNRLRHQWALKTERERSSVRSR
jgi:hypothetical protein